MSDLQPSAPVWTPQVPDAQEALATAEDAVSKLQAAQETHERQALAAATALALGDVSVLAQAGNREAQGVALINALATARQTVQEKRAALDEARASDAREEGYDELADIVREINAFKPREPFSSYDLDAKKHVLTPRGELRHKFIFRAIGLGLLRGVRLNKDEHGISRAFRAADTIGMHSIRQIAPHVTSAVGNHMTHEELIAFIRSPFTQLVDELAKRGVDASVISTALCHDDLETIAGWYDLEFSTNRTS